MDTDVIVIGAGAAGIAAALWLAERSVRVVVIEGRDRIGGRVLWSAPGSVETPGELGAEFIHGAAPETSAFLHDAGLSAVETGGESWIRRAGGALVLADDDVMDNDLFDRARDLAEDESVATFLRRFESDPALRERAKSARMFVEGFEAADTELASTRSIADEIHSGVDSTSSRPVGSYAPLFGYLAARCARAGIDIRLKTRVTQIAWADGGATADTVDDAGVASTLRARCAIVTVPVGVLQQGSGATPLTFTPELPPATITAVHGLAMGHAVRVVLAFRTPFWETIENGRYRDAAFFRCDDGPFNALWTQLPHRDRTISCWAGGPRATALRGVSDRERIERARDEFGDLFGQRDLARAEFEGGVTHDWTSDPFACGAYSYVVTGAATARADLGVPVGNSLFFAGEATATDGQGGTVSGAFSTGMRAAREALHALEPTEAH